MADNDLSLKDVNILVAEDNPLNQLVVKRYLEKWKATYEITDNGLKALDLIKQKDFDLIFLDIQMPGMDGYEIAYSTRQLTERKYKELPIIAFTGSVSPNIEEKIKSSGMNDYILKPFNPDDLFLKICKFTKKESFN